jgi:Putative DNA-binding domain
MALDHKPLDQLVEADLVDLVENAVPEGTTIDYKAELPTGQDEDKREFLRDASSFANTAGGHLVFGMTEDGGVPTGVPGVEVASVEDVKLRIENMLRDGIAPRLPQVGVQDVSLANGRVAIVVRIARSWQRPHMVAFKGLSQFWARNSAGKYQLDVTQIRNAVLSAPNAAASIRSFRQNRIAALEAGDVPASLPTGAKLIVHLVPIDALDEGRALLDVGQVAEDARFRPLYGDRPYPKRWNLDGLYTDDRWNDRATSFVQLYRTGVIESVDSYVLAQRQYEDGLFARAIERILVDGIGRYTSVQRDIGASLPVVVLVTLTGVRGLRLATENPAEQYADLRADAPRIDRDTLLLPDVLLDDWESDVATLLRPVCDAFWQSAGRSRSPSYDEDGNFRAE